jgi:hypothetical protein
MIKNRNGHFEFRVVAFQENQRGNRLVSSETTSNSQNKYAYNESVPAENQTVTDHRTEQHTGLLQLPPTYTYETSKTRCLLDILLG